MSKSKTRESFAESFVAGIVDDRGNSAPVAARLDYDAAEPFAMSILFDVEPVPQRWKFARDLFIDGYYTPTGEGDVIVFPCLDAGGRATVVISLSSPQGEASVEVNARTAAHLIWRMVDLVPRGAEGPAFDVDAFVANVLWEQTHITAWAKKR